MRPVWLWGGLSALALALLLSADSESTPYDPEFKAASTRYRLPWPLLREVARAESSFNPEAWNSESGASGLMQFLPSTAEELGIDPWLPAQAIEGAARYLRTLYGQFGSWPKALAAYNWGPGNLSKKGLANAPEETRKYTEQITKRAGIQFAPPWG